MLKVVAMAMPVYTMSCFKLPKKTCEKLTSAMSQFWWNLVDHKKKTHWLSWEKLCLSKDQGGLGFRDIQCFNQALLAKQAWRLLQSPDCLFSRVIKSIYYDSGNFIQAKMGRRPSYTWRSILHGRDMLLPGLRKMVENGRSISVWTEKWIFDQGFRAPLIDQISFSLDLKVSELIDYQNRRWNNEKLEELFYMADTTSILLSQPVVGKDDFWVWLHNKSSDYSVKSGYWQAFYERKSILLQEASAQPSLNDLKVQVWSLQTSPKIKSFLWRTVSNIIPVADVIALKGMTIDSRCQICGLEGESSNHVLFTCALARQVWALSS